MKLLERRGAATAAASKVRETVGMARYSRVGVWGFRERRIRAVIGAAVAAAEASSKLESNPLVFPAVGKRNYFFALGASRQEVDGGFDSQEAMDALVAEKRRAKAAVVAAHGQYANVPNGEERNRPSSLLRSVVRKLVDDCK